MLKEVCKNEEKSLPTRALLRKSCKTKCPKSPSSRYFSGCSASRGQRVLLEMGVMEEPESPSSSVSPGRVVEGGASWTRRGPLGRLKMLKVIFFRLITVFA